MGVSGVTGITVSGGTAYIVFLLPFGSFPAFSRLASSARSLTPTFYSLLGVSVTEEELFAEEEKSLSTPFWEFLCSDKEQINVLIVPQAFYSLWGVSAEETEVAEQMAEAFYSLWGVSIGQTQEKLRTK